MVNYVCFINECETRYTIKAKYTKSYTFSKRDMKNIWKKGFLLKIVIKWDDSYKFSKKLIEKKFS